MDKKFLNQLEEIIEEKVKLDKNFNKYKNWDSLSMLSIIILIQNTYKINLSNKEINKAKNFKGLCKLIEKRK